MLLMQEFLHLLISYCPIKIGDTPMKRLNVKRLSKFLVAFVISLILSITITAVYVTNLIALETTQMEQLAMNKSNKVNMVLTDLLYKTKILSALVVQNNGEVEDFERTAATIVDDPSIRNVLLAPDGIVRYVYPLEGNEAVVGFDYFSEKAGNKEAIQAKEEGRLVLGGPFELVQGGAALVGRLPVYVGDEQKFWGIASVTLDYPQALNGAELEMLQNQGYAFEIWRINPDDGLRQVIANSNYAYKKNSRYVEYSMDILNAKWYFRLSPIKAWYEIAETWIFILTGLVVSLLLGFMNLHNYDLNHMRKDLERLSYYDPLTGVMNRRGVFQELENMLAQKPVPFVLCFLDMNHFKSINDRYGHHMGDTALRIFSDHVRSYAEAKGLMFARIGGDEFILVFKNMDNYQEADALLKQIEESLSDKKTELLDPDIILSVSKGYAVYPKDGSTIDELVTLADANMYRHKKLSSGE